MSENDFIVVLPSNVASGNLFRENTIANYTTKLNKRLNLKGEWEVGLVEISFTKSWYNVEKDMEVFIVYLDEYGKDKPIKLGTYVPSGRYEDSEKIKEAIHRCIVDYKTYFYRKSDKLPRITIDKVDGIVTIKHGIKNNCIIHLEMAEDLKRMLGINPAKMAESIDNTIKHYRKIFNELPNVGQNPNKKFVNYPPPPEEMMEMVGNTPFDLKAGLTTLYVYIDIIKPIVVGDTASQLLRLVSPPPEAKYGDQVVLSFPQTYYLPLTCNEFETIQVDIKGDTGQRIPFEFGRTVLTLHFRRKS